MIAETILRLGPASLVLSLMLATAPAWSSAAGESAADRGCTSLYLSGANGTRLLATNLDYRFSEGRVYVNKRGTAKHGWSAGTTGVVAQWTSSYGSVTFNLAGYQQVWAGMNEAGLVISTMSLNDTKVPPPDAAPPLESGVWIQYLLDTSATVEEAIANAGKVRMERTVDHYLLGDRSGAAAVIEFVDGRTVVHSGGRLPVAALTNSTYERSVEGWRTMRVPDTSIARFIIAANGVTGYGDIPARDATDYAFSVLAKARQLRTVWSIVFDPANTRVSFFTHTRPRVRSINLRRLDFSCVSPVMMLDVNADTSGDVTRRLSPYSHADALVHMKAAFRVFAPSMSESEVESFLRFLEFGCAGSR